MSSHRARLMHTSIATTPSVVAQASTQQRLLLLALLMVAFTLRLFKLGGESLWYDETVSVYLARLPLTELVAHTARDIHPPAYYIMLSLWQLLASPTVTFGLEFLVAWPSLFFDLLAIALTYAIARKCFGARAGLWAIALAALHPSQLWGAQEVRMYALGAFCLMLSLWAVLPLLTVAASAKPPNTVLRRTLIIYPFAALLGLYTLYYFLFWLLVLNVVFVLRLWQQGQQLRTWVILQLAIVIGYLPWLPIFVRQALTPPVPPWRVGWQNMGDVARATGEAFAALWIGHTPPNEVLWLWAMLVLLVGAAFVVYAKNATVFIRWLWLFLVFGPLLTLLLITLVGIPIYHVRYVATYAPLFVIVLAASLAHLRPLPASAWFGLVAAISVASLYQLWTNPLYAADDHRSAVATLARAWRPGDVILVNAGWAYTALEIYWPRELATPDAAHAPDLAGRVRLDTALPTVIIPSNVPVLYTTGSIDGEPNLGWQLPQSDFFAISGLATETALAHLAAHSRRIWHYRLYDTVSDPQGLIRTWLQDNTELIHSQAISGRDYLLLESYATAKMATLPVAASAQIEFTVIEFAVNASSKVALTAHTFAQSIHAGETLYITLGWQLDTTNTGAGSNENVRVSVRLYDAEGNFWLQDDTTIEESVIAALPIPANTPPGTYTVGVVAYSAATLAPYTATTANGLELSLPVMLGEVTVAAP